MASRALSSLVTVSRTLMVNPSEIAVNIKIVLAAYNDEHKALICHHRKRIAATNDGLQQHSPGPVARDLTSLNHKKKSETSCHCNFQRRA